MFIIFGVLVLANKIVYNFASNLTLLYITMFQRSGNDVLSHLSLVCKHAVQ